MHKQIEFRVACAQRNAEGVPIAWPISALTPTFSNKADAEKFIRMMRDNSLRTGHNPPADEYAVIEIETTVHIPSL